MAFSPYDEWADIYDGVFSYVVNDIPFYVDEARNAEGLILELGCGTGRVAIPMALNGARVIGIDSSAAMLERAREKAYETDASNLKLVQADIRDFELEEKFSLVVIPFRSFLSLLSVEDELRTLSNIKRHLEPGGKVALDIFVPDLNMLVQEGDVPYHFKDVVDPATGQRLVIWNQASYDPFSQIMSIRTTIEKLDDLGYVSSKMYRDFSLRYIFRWEMHHLLRSCGFDVLAFYGDFERGEFYEGSTDMIWIATPAD